MEPCGVVRLERTVEDLLVLWSRLLNKKKKKKMSKRKRNGNGKETRTK